MGFQEHKNFIQALLAKQDWCLVTKGQSLLHCILKAKCLPRIGFLNAFRGNNSSQSWRSIYAARCLLLKRLNWKIGNGKLVRVWEDNWVDFDGCITRPTVDVEYDARHTLYKLIDDASMTRKSDVIKKLFSQQAAKLPRTPSSSVLQNRVSLVLSQPICQASCGWLKQSRKPKQ